MNMNVILDLDETLIHSKIVSDSDEQPFKDVLDESKYFTFSLGPNCHVHTMYRPHLEVLFNFIKEYKIGCIVYSAGSKDYVEAIAKNLQTKFNIWFYRILSKESCTFSDNNVYKYQPMFDNKKVIFIDDRSEIGFMYTHSLQIIARPFKPRNYFEYSQDSEMFDIVRKLRLLIFKL